MSSVLLGVSGSVAAYRAADLARELMRHGNSVRVCLTDAATKFVTPALFEALTGQPCLQDVFDEPERARMAHIEWARQAEVLVIAPATANTICKIAQGIGDDMLTTLTLAFTGPIVIAPAMNPSMYSSDPVQASIQILQERATSWVEPEVGDVACGENGQGKFASVDKIVEVVQTILARSRSLQGLEVLITAGPTQEPIDDVRFMSNRSSGKMGVALARAAMLMGGNVTIICDPTSERMPLGAHVVRVQTALEMLDSAKSFVGKSDLIVGAAAVADFRLQTPTLGKIRRNEAGLELKLVPNPDILAELASIAPDKAICIGFAAEPDSSLEEAKAKLARKRIAAIAHNDVSRQDIGFGAESNELTLILADGTALESSRMSKLACALWLFEKLAPLIPH